MKISSVLLGTLVPQTESMKTLSDLVGGCGSGTSPYTCKTNCGFKNTASNGYKLMFQGKDSLMVRYTGWEDGILSNTDIKSPYRLHMRFENCKAEVIDAIDNWKIKLDMMDYQVRYIREAAHREDCDDNSGLHMQWKRSAKNKDLANKGKDAFILNVSGVQTATMGKPLKVGDIKKCLSKAVINIAKYTETDARAGNKLYDYTKCEAYKYCGKDIDWDEDGTTTEKPTTKPTTKPSTVPPSTDVSSTTVRPTGSTTKPTGDSEFSCSGQECTITMADGTQFIGLNRAGIIEFRNVPYAEAPVGDLRWRAPIIRYDYHGATMDQTGFGPSCANNKWDGSYDEKNPLSEDCLGVNIHVKKSAIESGQKLPIMYYIHGGGFNQGTNKGSFKNLVLDQDVMVISIGYRLGIYGFMYNPTVEEGQEFSGNWGLLDQSAAMEWGNTWAPYFGGDVNQVSLNGCSAGSESIWWHLVMEKSWPFFHRAATVGIGLNSAYDADLGSDMFDAVLSNSECTTMECLRELTNEQLKSVATATTDSDMGTLEPGFGPVVDGDLLVDQLIISVRNGHLRQNTPISWNYAEHDSWGFVRGAFKGISEKVPALAAQSAEITAIMQETGIKVPSDFTDQYLELVYGHEHLDEILRVFGCSSTDGTVLDCAEDFSRFLVASHWACNSRWAINGVLQSDSSYGPVYPMQFQYRNCDEDENGVNKKTCHCAEGNWILGRKDISFYEEQWEKDIAQAMRDAWGQFFREGTFPANTLEDYKNLDGKFNIIDDSFHSAKVFEDECAILDVLDNYLWDKWTYKP